MIVYKYFIKMALKYKWVIIGYSFIFFVIAVISSSGNVERDINFEEYKLNIGIINKSEDQLARGLEEYLNEKNNIVETKNDEKYIQEQIFLEIADAVIIIAEDFEERIKNNEEAVELFKDNRKMGSYNIENHINKFLMFALATDANDEYDLELVEDVLNEKIQVNILNQEENLNQAIENWFNNYYNFLSYLILAIYISVIGAVMLDFKEEKVDIRTRVSSIHLSKFNKSIYLGQLSLALLITSAFIVGSIIMRGKYIREVQFSKYLLNTLIFTFSALCLVFLITNIAKNKYMITGLGVVLSLGTSFISGVMVPQSLLGENVLNIAKFFPTYYFVKANNMRISSLLDIKYELFMQILFGIIFLLIGLYFSKVKRKAKG